VLDLTITNKGKIDGARVEVYGFIATWRLMPETISEAKLRGIPEQIDLETIVSTRFHIIGERLRGKSDEEVRRIAENEAKRLMRVALFGRLDVAVEPSGLPVEKS